MKVLFLIPDFPMDPANIKGGVHSSLVNLLQAFRESDAEVLVITYSKSVTVPATLQMSNNVKVMHYPKSYSSFPFIPSLLAAGRELKEAIRSFAPDIVHFQMGGIFLLFRYFIDPSIPVVLTIHGMSKMELKDAKGWKKRSQLFLHNQVSKITIPDNLIHLSESSRQLSGFTEAKNLAIIPNPVSPVFFQNASSGFNPEKLLYLGAINPRKNLILLLNALAELRSQGCLYELTIVGDYQEETYRREVESVISSLNLEDSVSFLGWQSQKQILDIIREIAILVMPSEQENMPMAALEVMASGKPVIATKVGGIPEIIDDGRTGFLFEKGDSKALVEILKNLYHNPGMIIEAGKAAKEKMEESYKAERIASRLLQYYQNVVKKESGQ